MRDISEAQAVEEIVTKIEKFRAEHGRNALRDALNNGAFQVHPDYGDVTYAIKYRDFDHDMITVPLWITDLFDDIID